uniref:Retrotransposon gag protein n=1 Tax=Populus trichocarpa TaxID=3694 RepID=A0A2K2C1J5_POPTR
MELSIAAVESSSLPMQKLKRNKLKGISSILDDLLEVNLIELPKVKCPKETNQVDNPNYCKYHRLINHPIEKCFVLKDKIMRLHKNRDIIFYEKRTAFNTMNIMNLAVGQSMVQEKSSSIRRSLSYRVKPNRSNVYIGPSMVQEKSSSIRRSLSHRVKPNRSNVYVKKLYF